MSHKQKKCLKVQAMERFKEITCLGRSKHADKIEAAMEYERLAARGAAPSMTKQEYTNAAIRDKIYSVNTYRTYEKHNNYFLAYCEAKGCKTLDQCKPLASEWLQGRIDQGKSAYTIQTEAAGLGKLFQCSVRDFGVKLPERRRDAITRSRGVAERDRGFSLSKNAEYINFCRGTGLRYHEIRELTRDQLIDRGNGEYALGIRGKGGRYREAPIVGPHKAEIVERIQNAEGRVWEKIPSHADTHSYRSDYATAIYHAYARPIEELPKDKKYCCRGDRKGEVFDKDAMKIASEALGHSRVEVVAGHYIR